MRLTGAILINIRQFFSHIAQTKIAAISKDFRYRRKAERFPIIKATADDFPGSSSMAGWSLPSVKGPGAH